MSPPKRRAPEWRRAAAVVGGRHSRHRLRVAHHEAGHAVAAYLSRPQIMVTSATIKKTISFGGMVSIGGPLSREDSRELETIAPRDRSRRIRPRVEGFVIMCLAGAAAEQKHGIRGAAPRGPDRNIALELVEHMTYSEEERAAYIQWLWVRTKALLRTPHVWVAVEAVAHALLEREALSGRQVREIIRESLGEEKAMKTDDLTRRD